MTSSSNLTKQLGTIPLSVLDLAPIAAGGTARTALQNSLDLAQHVERWGYNRFWVAEHHNMPGIASSATSVVIGYIAGGTSQIRVGSGGVMLPNHASLVIAEQFGTLESLYPGRIDLGLGRAPGSDRLTSMALRRSLNQGDDFPEQVQELFSYFVPSAAPSSRRVRAIPGEGLTIPVWLLGSSDFSARLAGQLGLPFAFASHFSPEYTLPALQVYRSNFQPSAVLQEPYVMVGANAVAADTDEEAEWLATTLYQQFLSIIRGVPGQMQPPAEMDHLWSDYEQSIVKKQLRTAIVGGPQKVKEQLNSFIADTQADEVIITSSLYHHADRLRSFEIIASLAKGEQ